MHVWDLRLYQRYYWRLQSPWMLRCMFRQKFTTFRQTVVTSFSVSSSPRSSSALNMKELRSAETSVAFCPTQQRAVDIHCIDDYETRTIGTLHTTFIYSSLDVRNFDLSWSFVLIQSLCCQLACCYAHHSQLSSVKLSFMLMKRDAPSVTQWIGACKNVCLPLKINLHYFYALPSCFLFWLRHFLTFWNQIDVLYWKSIPMFGTVLSVPINHEHRESTLY